MKSLAVLIIGFILLGCGRTYENHILVAQCSVGDLYVKEIVDTRTGARGGVYATYSLYITGRTMKTTEIDTNQLGSYKAPELGERLKIFRKPEERDWHLFVSKKLSPEAYESLASCIAVNIEGIHERMSVSRTPHKYFPSPDRVLPKIATLRYSNVAELRKEYQCAHNVILKVLDNGEMFDFHARGSSFIGVVFDNGRSIALNENPYFLFEKSDKVTNKIEFLRQCVNKSGKSLFQDFQISTLPSARVGEKRLQARQKAILANLEPNISSQRTR